MADNEPAAVNADTWMIATPADENWHGVVAALRTPPARKMTDPTAITGPLTIGQQIVADHEKNMIAEPCELAAAIDAAISAAVMTGRRLDFLDGK